MDDYGSGGVGAFVGGLIIVAVLIGLLLLCIIGIGWISAFERTNGGEVAVIRNGGLFDNKKVRGYLPEASDRENIGLWSEAHKYPSQQRFYKISSNADESDTGLVDQVRVPTSDGVNVGIEGTIYFKLNTEEKILTEFDNKFGTRKFAGRYPHEGDEGFAAWLNTILRPVIDNNLRKQIGEVDCSDLIPSCNLIQNQTLEELKNQDGQGEQANQKIAEIEASVNEGLLEDIQSQLGGPYINDIRFTLAKAVPPARIQQSIDQTQAAFAQVSRAEAKRRQAELDAQANKIRQEGYQNCPACAQIDALKAIPKTITTFAPGSGFAVTPGR
jgi:regulator of protease activity HflC (stomatin/prohibitin superfamily)